MPSYIVGIWVLLGTWTWTWGVSRTEAEWADVVGAMCGSILYSMVNFYFYFFKDKLEPSSQDKATSCISSY